MQTLPLTADQPLTKQIKQNILRLDMITELVIDTELGYLDLIDSKRLDDIKTVLEFNRQLIRDTELNIAASKAEGLSAIADALNNLQRTLDTAFCDAGGRSSYILGIDKTLENISERFYDINETLNTVFKK